MPDFCVCVPARNEAVTIPILLEALAEQQVDQTVRVALCVNNSDDGTERVARSVAAALGSRLDLHCETTRFAAASAHAGSARRAAMDLGWRLLDADDDILISTDADCRPPPTWIAAILKAAGPDLIVGGQIILDETEILPDAVRTMRRRFDSYWERVREIEDRIDPVPWDTAPRHGDHTGASLALRRNLYARAGGVPRLPFGEDKALVSAALRVGAKLIHPCAVWTRASARTVGRAEQGMALEMQRLSIDLEQGRTPLVPAFSHWRKRAKWRRHMRACLVDCGELSTLEAEFDPMPCDMALPEAPLP